tara:strand:- start:359 stop:529 length:171 start_codon:yes stop_codon:yes gene_type:complete
VQVELVVQTHQLLKVEVVEIQFLVQLLQQVEEGVVLILVLDLDYQVVQVEEEVVEM